MSSFTPMRALESAPEPYDRGIQILSRGRIGPLHRVLAEMLAAPGKRILDIVCGTGGVSLACAARGAEVVGIDISPGMIEVARAKAGATTARGSVQWLELGAAEIADRFGESTFDGVVSCLAFSELSEQEQEYTLRLVLGRLKPGGDLVLADEVMPDAGWARLRYRLQRAALAALAYAWAQTRVSVGRAGHEWASSQSGDPRAGPVHPMRRVHRAVPPRCPALSLRGRAGAASRGHARDAHEPGGSSRDPAGAAS